MSRTFLKILQLQRLQNNFQKQHKDDIIFTFFLVLTVYLLFYLELIKKKIRIKQITFCGETKIENNQFSKL